MNIFKDKRLLAILIIALFFAVVSVVGIIATRKPQTTGDTQPNAATEAADKAIDESTQFLNEQPLIDRGLTSVHIDGLEQAFNKFKPNAKRVTIIPSTVKSHWPDEKTGVKPYTFTVDIDGTLYQARAEVPNLTTIRLFLMDSAGKTVFDSQNIDTYNG